MGVEVVRCSHKFQSVPLRFTFIMPPVDEDIVFEEVPEHLNN